LTDEGIFLIYNGADDNQVYSTGWVLFDKKSNEGSLTRPTAFIRPWACMGESVSKLPTLCLWKDSYAMEDTGSFIMAERKKRGCGHCTGTLSESSHYLNLTQRIIE
jgi:hypothetical protein